MRALRSGLLALALFACVTPKPTPTPVPPSGSDADGGMTVVVASDGGLVRVAALDAGPAMDVGALRTEAKDLLHAQQALLWKAWTEGGAGQVAGLYDRHDALFGPASLAAVSRAAAAAKDPDEARALRYFHAYLLGEAVAKAVAPLTQQIAVLEGTGRLKEGGAYRDLPALLAREPTHARRVALVKGSLPVLAQLNALYQQKEQTTQETLTALGAGSYAEASSDLRQMDLPAVAKLAADTLDRTDALYTRAMGEAAHRELSLDLKDLRKADIPRFFHHVAVQSAFPAEQLLPRLKALLLGLGVDLTAMKNLTIDDRALALKTPRAVCIPVEVPGDIRLSVKPLGGVDDYLQLFHETGHAVHFAYTKSPVWEFQQLGDNAVSEAYALLLEDRLEDPRYLAELGMTGELLSKYVRSAAVKKLYLLRRYAAKVQYEQVWHAGDKDPRARYAELLGRAYGFPLEDADAASYLADHDDFFYSADYLRAFFLAAQLDQVLTQKFGDAWWHQAAAGDLLQSLWKEGNRLGPDEVAQQLGVTLDPGPLLATLEARLKEPEPKKK
jgi:hypothetical protein